MPPIGRWMNWATGEHHTDRHRSSDLLTVIDQRHGGRCDRLVAIGAGWPKAVLSIAAPNYGFGAIQSDDLFPRWIAAIVRADIPDVSPALPARERAASCDEMGLKQVLRMIDAGSLADRPGTFVPVAQAKSSQRLGTNMFLRLDCGTPPEPMTVTIKLQTPNPIQPGVFCFNLSFGTAAV